MTHKNGGLRLIVKISDGALTGVSLFLFCLVIWLHFAGAVFRCNGRS